MSALERIIKAYQVHPLCDEAAAELAALRAERDEGRAQVYELTEILRDLLDDARTSLAPDELNLTPEQWSVYRLNKIAARIAMTLRILENDYD